MNRCEGCGRFVAWEDLEQAWGSYTMDLGGHLSEIGGELLCKRCRKVDDAQT